MPLNKEKTLIQRWLLNFSMYYPAPKASSQLVKFMTAALLTIKNVFLKTPISGLVKSALLNFCYCLDRSSVLSTEQDLKKAHFSKHVVVKTVEFVHPTHLPKQPKEGNHFFANFKRDVLQLMDSGVTHLDRLP